MDLFVINRYRDDNEEVDLLEQETLHLQRLKQKIEERKKAHNVQKNADDITLVQKKQSENIEEEPETKAKELLIKEKDQYQDKPIEKLGKEKASHDFKILGISDFEKKTKVKRILPHWLSHPFSISTDLKNAVCPVEDQNWLHTTLKTTLLAEGITHFFPVQEQVIPFVLKEHKQPLFWPHDICVSAPTGSGKTLAFVLPIIQILMEDIGHHVRALIVLPVQELATQVAKVFRKYCTRTGLKIALLSGSIPLRKEQQQIVKYTESSGWVSEVDIIVSTAGRLVEHLQNTEGFSLKHLKFLVIDEADRIMDHIQNDWLYHLDRHIKLENKLITGKVTSLNWLNLSETKPPPHKLLFSATLSQDPEKLEQWGLFQPKLFSSATADDFEDEDTIRKYVTPQELQEHVVTCNPEEKPLLLYHFLTEQKWNKVLCFTNAAQSAHRLTVLLNVWGNGAIKVAELSAALDRSTREEVLKQFTNSEINVLISTDALARGIDIPQCEYVVSYDPPRNIKTYIHRVGRTGRAGRSGLALTMLLHQQARLFKDLLQAGGKSELTQLTVDPDVFDRLIDGYERAINETKEFVQQEINSKVQKSIKLKRGNRLKRKHDQ